MLPRFVTAEIKLIRSRLLWDSTKTGVFPFGAYPLGVQNGVKNFPGSWGKER